MPACRGARVFKAIQVAFHGERGRVTISAALREPFKPKQLRAARQWIDVRGKTSRRFVVPVAFVRCGSSSKEIVVRFGSLENASITGVERIDSTLDA